MSALSLGNLQVNSALDEPLDAEIELSSVTASELSSLEIRMGTLVDFQRAEIQRTPLLSLVKFNVSEHVGDRITALLTTEFPVSEPFLHFLVVVEWAGGKLIREYTALLDPPLYTGRSSAAVSMPRVVGGTDKTDISTIPVATTPDAEPIGVDESSADTSDTGMMGPADSGALSENLAATRKGDTLWSIAERVSQDRNIYRVMLALMRRNPDAFINNNMNLLKTGQILQIPELTEIDAITLDEAVNEYGLQIQEWEDYKSRLAGAAESAQVADSDTEASSIDQTGTADAAAPGKLLAAGGDETQADDPTVPATDPAAGSEMAPAGADSEDLLRIVQDTLEQTPGQAAVVTGTTDRTTDEPSGATNNQEIMGMQNQISTLEESLLSRDLENKELREKVAALEEQVKNTARLIEIENQNLLLAQQQAQAKAAELQKAKEKQKAAQAAAKKKKAKVEITTTKKVTNTDGGSGKKVSKPAGDKAADTKVAKKAAKKIPAKKVAQQGPEPSKSWWEDILDSMMSNTLYLVAVGLFVILLFSGLFIFIRRRKSIAEFEDSILSGSALDVNSETTGTGAGTDTSFLSDFGVPGMGTMQADEVDPIAEAEVYLAYGRDEQAEEVLKEAISRDKDRSELKLKLLEIYQQRNDVTSFETLAEELYPAHSGTADETWQRVAIMGSKLSPDNPLFKTAALAAAGTAAVSAATEDIPKVVPTGADSARMDPGMDSFPEAETKSDAGEDLEPFPEPDKQTIPDLNLGDLEGDADTTAGDPTLDFDLEELVGKTQKQDLPSDIDKTKVLSSTGSTGVPKELTDSDDLSFDLDDALDLGSTETEASEKAETKAADDDFDLELSMDDFDLDDDTLSDNSNQTKESPEIDTDGMGLSLDDQDFGSLEELTDEATRAQSPETTVAMDLPEITSPELGIAADTVSDLLIDDDSTAAVDKVDRERWDEAATKLDLAKAYIDMGDKAGAKSIIEEVMQEGDEGQKSQAAELAAQIES